MQGLSSPRHPPLKLNLLQNQLVSHASLHLKLVLEVGGSFSPPEYYSDQYQYKLYEKIILYVLRIIVV